MPLKFKILKETFSENLNCTSMFELCLGLVQNVFKLHLFCVLRGTVLFHAGLCSTRVRGMYVMWPCPMCVGHLDNPPLGHVHETWIAIIPQLCS
jgi:hypothetical protein